MFALLEQEETNTQLEGVTYNALANRGTVTVTARDEQHRQKVL